MPPRNATPHKMSPPLQCILVTPAVPDVHGTLPLMLPGRHAVMICEGGGYGYYYNLLTWEACSNDPTHEGEDARGTQLTLTSNIQP